MKKNYALLASALMISVAGFSQDKKVQIQDIEAKPEVSEYTPKSSSANHLKVYGDTMAYFDFNGSLPTGWTIFNNANNNHDWIWSTSAPRGQFTSAPAINSTTGPNGFMMLESDYYNTPIPGPGAIAMDAFFQSNAIPIDSVGSVLVRFQQSFRFCCRGSSEMDLSVSTDGSNWVDYDVKGSTGTNIATANPKITEINISDVAANEDTIYIRFHQATASHYYWMIDDIAIVEGPSNDLVQESFITQYKGYPYSIYNGVTETSWQYYEQIPLEIATPMWIQTNVKNNGGTDANNVDVSYTVTQDLDCNGQPGKPAATQSQTMSMGTIMANERDTAVFTWPFTPRYKGQYTLTTNVSSPAVDQEPANNSTSDSFIISDTTYAKDDGTSEGSVGPASYVATTGTFREDGARLLLYYRLDTPATLTSMTYYIGNTDRVDNTSFTAEVYEYNAYDPGCTGLDAPGCFSTNPIASNPFAINVDSTMRGTWITVPLLAPVLLDTGGYVVGYTATGFTTTQDFVVGRDVDADEHSPYDTQFIYDYHTFIYSPSASYGISGSTPMMRMNFGLLGTNCIAVGLEEPKTETGFNVYPNPNNGQFSVGVSSKVAMDYTLRVTNMLGQNVLTEEISVQNTYNKNMDLSSLDKGVYFVTLENDFERYTKKIIIK